MATIADRFQVFGVELVTADGSEAKANGSVTIGIKADFTYNRNQVAAYLLDEDGGLTKLNVSNGGSYVNVETDKSGTIILCIPGVAFHMPIWGYILILVGCLIVAAGVTVAVVFAVKRRKRRAEARNFEIRDRIAGIRKKQSFLSGKRLFFDCLRKKKPSMRSSREKERANSAKSGD